MKVKLLSHVRLFATSWTVAHQAPPSMGFFRQEYWSGLPFPSPGDLLDPGIEPRSPALQADALTSEPPGQTPGNQGSPLYKLLRFRQRVGNQCRDLLVLQLPKTSHICKFLCFLNLPTSLSATIYLCLWSFLAFPVQGPGSDYTWAAPEEVAN